MADIGFAYTGTPPLDLAAAPARARRAYWREAARKGVELRRVSLSKGIGRDGVKLQPISPRTVRSRRLNIDPVTNRKPYSPMGRAHPRHAPLQATGAKSRTRSWLYGRAETDRAWFGWRNGWGDILALHRRGFWKKFFFGWAYIPPRDVIGLPPGDVKALDTHMARWWTQHRDELTGAQARAQQAADRMRPPSKPKRPSGRVYETGKGPADWADGRGHQKNVDFGQFFGFRGPGDWKYRDLPPLTPPPRPPTPTRPSSPALQTSVRRRQPAPPAIARRPVPLLSVPYDGPLPDAIRERLPEELKGVETFGQLARLRIGRLWWAAVGLTVFLELLRRAA